MWPGSDRASPPPPAGRAVPSLGPFAELLGQPYQRLKVAVLRQLAGLPQTGWSLADAGQALTWLEPATANRLVSELRTDGLVVEVDRYGQPDGPPAWRLSDEGHLVATVCAVLAAPATAPERAVKVLAAAMALARAAGVDERAAFAPFVAATAVLERDLATLHRLIDQGADDDLDAAGGVAAVHLDDLAEMARQVARPGGHEAERERAAAVAGRLRALLDELETGQGAEPGGAADTLTALVADTDPAALAGLVAGRLRLPPAVAPARAADALAALDQHLGRPEPVVVPLPEPTLLPIESPEVVPDFVLLAADVMTWLAGLGETDLAKWVVGGTWAEATARMAAVVEAWSRWGPAGDGSLAAELDPRPRLEIVGRDEVGVVSWTGVRAPGGQPAAEGPTVVDLTDQPEGDEPALPSSGGLPLSPPDPPPDADRQEVAT
ncbi:MAG TPA: hypothetical protein VHO93_17430 [Actinomycetota bacterium]|nr:hypothetical protein [Actinomycetota bacterium]